ncbi:MAG: DUF3108 domain-containing protein [Candidatus Zixiibacteriota bacterium]|nr:MAG: DUF3108 domain-containing protein [candidate division Zixibacteria bacterium]
MRKPVTLKSKIAHLILMFVILAGLIPLFYFATVEIGIARAEANDSTDTVATPGSIERYVENVAFGVNEKFTYDINYGFINAGGATMEVARLIEYNNRPCYQTVTRAYSNSFFSTFFKVDDRVESIIDALGIFPWRFEKNLREGPYRSDRQYSFDQRQNLVFYKGDTIEVAPYAQDALSILYWVRTQPLEVGKSIFVENFTDGKKYSLEVRVLRKESVDVPAGTFDCIVVEPLLKSVGVFKHEGKLTVWLSDDRLRMPVLMKSKVLVGSFAAELTDYQLGDIEIF